MSLSATVLRLSCDVSKHRTPRRPGHVYAEECPQNNLAHNFAIDDQDEVLTDLAFGETPGGSEDGIDPNTDVILERIWITPTGTSAAGTITVTLSDLSAATTQGDPSCVRPMLWLPVNGQDLQCST